jgi:transposase
MLHVRITITASGATAVQVIRYVYRKRVVVKHIGSAHTKEDLASLKKIALQWIAHVSQQPALFPLDKKETTLPLVSVDKLRNLGFHYTFAYETLMNLLQVFNLSDLSTQLLLDLVLIRIMKPASKIESLRLLKELFGITHQRATLYRSILSIVQLKLRVEESVIALARRQFSFDFSIVFYDVTTLYFESFTEDEDILDMQGNILEKGLRKNGFGKEIKHGQPIIVIGLIVTKEGFPISYDLYEGNTFEGKTFIPIIKKFKDTYKVENLTVVADAAMISLDNIEKLKEYELSYIVGARMANLKDTETKQAYEELIGQNQTAEELQKIDGRSMRMQTERGLLVCDFSFKRYQKDKREMEKQIARAEKKLQKNEGIKRTKFIKNRDKKKTEQVLNTALITKTKLLLGIKGYYTNLFEKDEEITNTDIITHYHSLWHVEKAFRIAKSDLAMRPIYHFKRQTIEAHILICFMALAVCKYMELKSEKSTKAIIHLLTQVTDARILHTVTNEEIILRSEISTETENLVKKISLSH